MPEQVYKTNRSDMQTYWFWFFNYYQPLALIS